LRVFNKVLLVDVLLQTYQGDEPVRPHPRKVCHCIVWFIILL